MKVVLINPPVSLDVTLGKLKEIPQAMSPLGLGYVSGMLYKNGIDVEVIDAFAQALNVEETVELTLSKKPDVVGISCLTPGMPIAQKLANELKKKNNKIIICFGGIHPSLMPEETLSNAAVDIVVRGEGEITTLELIKALETKKSLRSIKGISFRDSRKKITHNPDREFIQNLDSLPFPAWHLFPTELYIPPPHWHIVSPAFPIFGSRGCPYKCTYCSLKTMGKKLRERTTNNIVDEIEHLINKYNAKQIMFLDASFPLIKEKAMEVCDEIIKRGLHKKIVWLCETRVNLVDFEILKKMREAGCRRIVYGVESGVQELLDNVNKGFTLNQVRKAIELTKKANIEIIACFMLGLPGETKKLSNQTIKFAKELDVDYAKFNLAVPYPGTKLYEQTITDGTLKSAEWGEFTSFSSFSSYDPVHVPKGMTKEELQALQKKAYRTYYFRPKMIFRHLKKIKSGENLKKYFATFKSLAKGVFT